MISLLQPPVVRLSTYRRIHNAATSRIIANFPASTASLRLQLRCVHNVPITADVVPGTTTTTYHVFDFPPPSSSGITAELLIILGGTLGKVWPHGLGHMGIAGWIAGRWQEHLKHDLGLMVPSKATQRPGVERWHPVDPPYFLLTLMFLCPSQALSVSSLKLRTRGQRQIRLL